MRYFELKDSKSNKFWQVEQRESDIYVCWGKIGTKGQEQVKSFEDENKATAYMTKLVKEKTAKGYIELGNETENSSDVTNEAITEPNTSVIKATQKKKQSPKTKSDETAHLPSTTLTTQETLIKAPPKAVMSFDAEINHAHAPWLDNSFQLPESFLSKALPSRTHPAAPQNLNAATSWNELHKLFTLVTTHDVKKLIFDFENTPPEFHAAYQETIKRLNENTLEGSMESDVILFVLITYIASDSFFTYYFPLVRFDNTSMTDFLVAHKGLEYAIDIFLLAQQLEFHINRSDNYSTTFISINRDIICSLGNLSLGGAYTLGELKFRTYLSYAEDATWQSCADKLLKALPTLHPSRQPLISVLLPENKTLSEHLAQTIPMNTPEWCVAWLKLTIPDIKTSERLQNISLFNTLLRDEKVQELALATLFLEQGIEVSDLLKVEPTTEKIITALTYIGTPWAMTRLASDAIKDKAVLPHFRSGIERFPIASIVALAQMSLERNAPLIEMHLNQLLFTHHDIINTLAPWLSLDARELVMKKIEKILAPVIIASDDMLPTFLTSPPWLKKKKAAFNPIDVKMLPIEAEIKLTAQEIEEWLKIPMWGSSYVIEAETNPNQLVKGLGFRSSNIQLFNDALNAINQKNTSKLIELIIQAQGTDSFREINFTYTRYLSDEMALSIWTNCSTFACYNEQYILARFTQAALPGLIRFLNTKIADNVFYWPKILSPELAPIVAKAFCKLKSVKNHARSWLVNNPKLSIIGLIPDAIGKAQEPSNHAKSALRLLKDNGHEALIKTCAQGYDNPDVIKAIEDILSEDPLDLYPSKITKSPSFWAPSTWNRPVLKENGHALSDTAIEHLGTMLRFPVAEGIYEGINQIKHLCEPNSLANFAWDLFNAWLVSGGPSKESWAFNTLGILGNDDTARMLTPLIRSWPGEAQHQRAVNGLEILNQIGSDVALMLLNGIAQKIKFKGLQDKAREKIADIAEARELTVEELEDRIAPNLGLDETGSLTLNFGNRYFLISFDENLKPFVRDSEGNRLKDLPKPKQSDDTELANEATNRYKLLKKDAKTVAMQQILRLELAMCQRRRWTHELFMQFLVNHPLLKYLVQRVVWGTYTVDDESNFGGQLMACFRVAEDGSFTTAEDETFTIPDSPQLRIGIPHALELSDEVSTQFSQLFSDYELLQPFTQLGRETFSLTEEELSSKEITRFAGKEVPTGKILGLNNRGWRRGDAMDGGGITYFSKPINTELSFFLEFEPGMIVGMLDEYPEQTLGNIICNEGKNYWFSEQKTHYFNQLDPILLSELIRDLSQVIS
ncbi:DUF4132 domain-containing protein [Thorsellia anophelis]|uniref:WGR domain-containing protein, predicted DNA-binding domain in MolR n=1 Tax=Thorsellia anophelis DSM 18579 TaxID=1123402 RepID=A0A1I0CMJ1_9GAMM|nr:DUF4132 domain-containing protein [Thorsellia anophelis]SET20863.1 WGR domain-containing protein, predicted DNA-binding domain in MolR [Thorsellia anophelis DSM 18579]